MNFRSDVRLEIREQHASDEGLNFMELWRKVSEGCDALQINSHDVTWRRYQVKRTCVTKNNARKGLVTFFVKQKGRKKIWDSFMTKNKIASEKYNEVKTFYIRKQCNTLLRHFYSTQKTEQAIRNTGISNLLWQFRPGAGNYSRLRATLRLYLCLTGQISVNKANSKLKKWPSRAECCPLLI